jgi:hypothetical protein
MKYGQGGKNKRGRREGSFFGENEVGEKEKKWKHVK